MSWFSRNKSDGEVIRQKKHLKLVHDSDVDMQHPLYVVYRDVTSRDMDSLIYPGSFRQWLRAQRELTKRWAMSRNPSYQEFEQWIKNTGADKRTKMQWPDTFIAWLSGQRW